MKIIGKLIGANDDQNVEYFKNMLGNYKGLKTIFCDRIENEFFDEYLVSTNDYTNLNSDFALNPINQKVEFGKVIYLNECDRTFNNFETI